MIQYFLKRSDLNTSEGKTKEQIMGIYKGVKHYLCITLIVIITLFLSVMYLSFSGYADSASIKDAIDELANEQEDIQSRIEQYESEIENIDFEKANVLEKKAVLDQRNLLAQEEIQVIEEQIGIIDGLVTNMQMDLDQARFEEEHQRELWFSRVRAMEEGATLNYIQVLFNATSFSDLLTRLDLINEIVEYDRDLQDSYVSARENVETLEAEAEIMFALNEESRTELEVKKAQLETDIETANQLIGAMEEDIESLRELQALEEEAAAEIKNQIAELEQEYEAARAAELAAWEAAQGQHSQGTGGGNANVTDGGSSLLWPSYCTIVTSYYGNRLHPVYGYYKFHYGVDIGAAGGTAIWAPANGTVITSTYGSGYGNYVVIRHDNGYYTLCAHMSSRAVSSGQYVTQGQIIGYVGSTGLSTGNHIHYEVWDSSRATMDPMGVYHIYA